MLMRGLIDRVIGRRPGDLSIDKVALVRRALPADMVRRYGNAVISMKDEPLAYESLRKYHEAAGLAPYSLLTAFAAS
jgi:hypothetical protein